MNSDIASSLVITSLLNPTRVIRKFPREMTDDVDSDDERVAKVSGRDPERATIAVRNATYAKG